MSRRVVMTGIGPICGLGVGIDPLWAGLCEGRSAIRRITHFDPTGFPSTIAAELDADAFKIREIVPKSYRKATKVMCRDIELAVAAAAKAIEDAGLTTKAVDPDADPTYDPDRFGCQIGAGLISADTNELTMALIDSATDGPDGLVVDLADWGGSGMQNLTPLWLLKYLPNMLACHVTIVHDLRGPSNTITCCESSATLSLGESVRVIQRGSADACLTGGAEFKLNPMAFYRQACTGRLAPVGDVDATEGVVKPFDPEATGTVLGEGGGIVVLEAMETAEARGANLYAEVAGFAATQSFCADTVGVALDDADTGIEDAITLALEQAAIGPEAIDAIVPMGSGIPAVDAAEARAIRAVFGAKSVEIPLVTTTPNVGNCNAGNGAISLSVAAQCLKEQRLPARLNSAACNGLDAGACDTRDAALNHVLVMSAGQGGQNAAVVLKKV